MPCHVCSVRRTREWIAREFDAGARSGAGLLIDVGIGPKAIGERLESVGATWSRIAAAVLTHTHGDHIDSGAFAEMARPVSAFIAMRRIGPHLPKTPGSANSKGPVDPAYDDAPFMTATGLRLEPIELRHDGGPTFGFRIEVSAGRRQRPVSIGYLADTGTWSDAMVESLADVDVLGLEFNHDEVLQKSSRPRRFCRPKFVRVDDVRHTLP